MTMGAKAQSEGRKTLAPGFRRQADRREGFLVPPEIALILGAAVEQIEREPWHPPLCQPAEIVDAGGPL